MPADPQAPPPAPLRVRRRKLAVRLMVFFVALGVGFVAAEIAARIYVARIKAPRIYEIDKVLGHRLKPNLDAERRMPDGRVIRVLTDAAGIRIAPGEDPSRKTPWRPASRRILILGDSHVEATVNIEQRFDRLMEAVRPDWAVVAVGCGGYGTDQEVILGRKFFEDLHAGDLLIIFSCGNDMVDIVRQRQFGRARAYFTLDGERLVEHPAKIGWLERLREHSYLASAVMNRFDPYSANLSEAEWDRSRQLYAALIRSVSRPLLERGVHVAIVHNFDWFDPHVPAAYVPLRDQDQIPCLAVDEALGPFSTANPNWMGDAHWAPQGYRIVTDTMLPFVEQVISSH